MKHFILVMLSSLLLTACGSVVGPDGRPVGKNQGLTRYVDEEAEVVCWVYSSGYQGGLSCLPFDQVNEKVWALWAK